MLTRRLRRIFREDGRTLIVALDHGLTEGPTSGLEQPRRVLEQIAAGGADAILTSYGVAARFAAQIASLGLILRLDVGESKLGQMGPGRPFFTVEDALRVGADAVAVSAFPGTPQEADTMQFLAHTIAAAHTWGMPVMAELQPGGFDAGPEINTPEAVALSARIAAELGADWVKVPNAGDFSQVVAGCYVPVVMLGGVKVRDPRPLFEAVWNAVQAGAVGVAIGRNIFQADDPAAMVAALRSILHEGAGPTAALEIYQRRAEGARA